MKTVRQIAETAKVSKPTIRARIVALGLEDTAVIRGQTRFYPETAVDLILASFEIPEPEPETTEKEQKIPENHPGVSEKNQEEPEGTAKNQEEPEGDMVAILRAELELLHEQLNEKDQQIARLYTLLDQQQRLTMAAEQRCQALLEAPKQEPESRPWWHFWG